MRLLALALVTLGAGLAPAAERPNIVFFLADDLGYGDVGCYGQTKIRTPQIDRLAREGMRLTAHYAGSNVCAPSRCGLRSGLHPGHAFVRDNRQAVGFDEGQTPVPEATCSLPLALKKLGYASGGFGKWGLGPVDSSGDPLRQGFDRFFGYNSQSVAHNHYPSYLWDGATKVPLKNPEFRAHQKLPESADPKNPESYAAYRATQYAPDLIGEEARRFVREHKDRPFFLYVPTTIPHLALQVPDDSLQEYAGKFPDEPYTGARSYLPQLTPREAYAAMVTRMDREVGRLLDLIAELGLEERTIFVFTSDNGPLYDRHGGTDTEFFRSAAGFRGHKGAFYEGGFRVPCIVRWRGRIMPGTTSDRVCGFEDWLPTLLDLCGAPERVPAGIDGLSFAPTLLGHTQAPRPALYRESPGYGGQQCVREGRWKALRKNLHPGAKAKDQAPGAIELYDLEADPGETQDLAAARPELVERFAAILQAEHRRSELFPIRALDGESGGK